MLRLILIVISCVGLTLSTFGQTNLEKEKVGTDKKEKVEITKSERSEPEKETEKKEVKETKYRLLQDNSFFVEEAFAQEADAVQHTFKFRRSFNGEGWEGVFEEELPLGNEKHQLSIELPTMGFNSDEAGQVRGVGDVELNYRYQLLGGEASRVSVAPGVSAILPTGSYRRELGAGAFGIELSLPVSIAISDRFMAHSNVGVTFTPRARNHEGERAFTKNLEFGQSLVWLAHPKINPLVEIVWERNQEVIGNGLTKKEHEVFVSPGVRWGHTFKNGLVIVPGVALPIGIGSNRGNNGIFFYLSFEHPFKKKAE